MIPIICPRIRRGGCVGLFNFRAIKKLSVLDGLKFTGTVVLSDVFHSFCSSKSATLSLLFILGHAPNDHKWVWIIRVRYAVIDYFKKMNLIEGSFRLVDKRIGFFLSNCHKFLEMLAGMVYRSFGRLWASIGVD